MEFTTRPEPYQVAALFAHDGLQGKLNKEQFMVWYWAFSVGFVELAYFRFDLWKLEREMRSAAPASAAPTEFKESFVRLYMDTPESNLDKELKVRLIANKAMMSKQHNQFSALFKRQLSDVFLAI